MRTFLLTTPSPFGLHKDLAADVVELDACIHGPAPLSSSDEMALEAAVEDISTPG